MLRDQHVIVSRNDDFTKELGKGIAPPLLDPFDPEPVPLVAAESGHTDSGVTVGVANGAESDNDSMGDDMEPDGMEAGKLPEPPEPINSCRGTGRVHTQPEGVTYISAKICHTAEDIVNSATHEGATSGPRGSRWKGAINEAMASHYAPARKRCLDYWDVLASTSKIVIGNGLTADLDQLGESTIFQMGNLEATDGQPPSEHQVTAGHVLPLHMPLSGQCDQAPDTLAQSGGPYTSSLAVQTAAAITLAAAVLGACAFRQSEPDQSTHTARTASC